MLHEIPIQSISDGGQEMADAISTCVHCGFCLPACPTYCETGQETESPRGRILLMKHVLEGNTTAEEAAPHIDRCLGCLSCVPACPSGVPYGRLLNTYRSWSETKRKRRWWQTSLRRALLRSLANPTKARWALRLGRMTKPFARAFPWFFSETTKAALGLLPTQLDRSGSLPPESKAIGNRRARVALLAGCVQQVIAQEINRATIQVLVENGVDVVVPNQKCCGALAGHTGELELAKRMARVNFETFPNDVDAVITNAAGCGSAIREYPDWFRRDEVLAQAKEFSQRAMDVSVFLSRLGLSQEYRWTRDSTVAYQDACHLLNGQQVQSEPRELLGQVNGLNLVDLPGANFCCGSAGTYNMEQPETAHQLGEKKARAVVQSEAGMVCTGNIGCMVQMKKHLELLGSSIEVAHTIQILNMAERVGSRPNQRS